MTQTARQVLETFDRLPEPEQREVASQILRRTVQLEAPPLTDETLVLAAEELFLELDQREAADEQSKSR